MVLEINNFILFIFCYFYPQYHHLVRTNYNRIRNTVLLNNFTKTEQFNWLRWPSNSFINQITISTAGKKALRSVSPLS